MLDEGKTGVGKRGGGESESVWRRKMGIHPLLLLPSIFKCFYNKGWTEFVVAAALER